jgi:hypothetical protein
MKKKTNTSNPIFTRRAGKPKKEKIQRTETLKKKKKISNENEKEFLKIKPKI